MKARAFPDKTAAFGPRRRIDVNSIYLPFLAGLLTILAITVTMLLTGRERGL